MGRLLRPEDRDSFGLAISLYQGAAAVAPERPIRELLGLIPALTRYLAIGAEYHRTKPPSARSPGSFEDFDRLVEQLAKIPPKPLGTPPRRARRHPPRRVGSNPAAHNRALLGDQLP